MHLADILCFTTKRTLKRLFKPLKHSLCLFGPDLIKNGKLNVENEERLNGSKRRGKKKEKWRREKYYAACQSNNF